MTSNYIRTIISLERVCEIEEKYNREEIPEIKKIIGEYLREEPSQSPVLEIIGEYLKWTCNIGYHEICDFTVSGYYQNISQNKI